jgi:hypothetical protein
VELLDVDGTVSQEAGKGFGISQQPGAQNSGNPSAVTA